MDWIEDDAHWKVLAVKAKEKWSAITADDLEYLDRNKGALIAKVFERTGLARDTAERQVDALLATLATPVALERIPSPAISHPSSGAKIA